jgi:hypothetical protein
MLDDWKVVGDVGLHLCQSVFVEVELQDLSFFESEEGTGRMSQQTANRVKRAKGDDSAGITDPSSELVAQFLSSPRSYK